MNPELELVVFDMDGVLVDCESSWEWVHDHFEVDNDHSLKAYLNGEIDNVEFIRRDVSLWKDSDPDVSKEDIVNILKKVPLMNGFEKCIPTMSEEYHTAIISGGMKPLAEYIGKNYFDRIMANDFEEKDGEVICKPVIEVELKDKGSAFDQLIREMDIPAKNTAAVGNSHFDVPLLEKAGKGIAFDPVDAKVKKAADKIIEKKDLTLVRQSL